MDSLTLPILSVKQIDEIICFWFGDYLNDTTSDYSMWFDKSSDEFIKSKYILLVEQINIHNYKSLINGKLSMIALLIIGDQFTRNIYRDCPIKSKINDDWTLELALLMLELDMDLDYNLNMRYFILLVLRHQKKTIYLNIVLNRIKLYLIEFKSDIPSSLIKFYSHCIRSYTNLLDDIQISNPLATSAEVEASDFDYILFELNTKYTQILDDDITIKKEDSVQSDILSILLYDNVLKYLQSFKKTNMNIGISLSGGVDSMVLLDILIQIKKHTQLLDKIIAIHIEHSNRKEAIAEREFLVNYCNLLGVKIYYRTIDYMDRSTKYLDRSIYETESKSLRFNLYRYAIKQEDLIGICMGHHQGDCVENILTNLIKGKSFENLQMMSQTSEQFDVLLIRPLLSNNKTEIFKYARLFFIPYFKNSTPEWSCRGVIRDKVIKDILLQFGPFEHNMIKFAEQSTLNHLLIDELLIQPYIDSIVYFTYGFRINILNDKVNKYLHIVWDKILINYLHINGYPMISSKSKTKFYEWILSQNKTQFELSPTHFAFFDNINNNIYIINIEQIKKLNLKKSTTDDDLEKLLIKILTITSTLDYVIRLPLKIKKILI